MLNPNNDEQEIRQSGKYILSGNHSLGVIFNNLTGKNFTTNKEYQWYIKSRLAVSDFTYGEIELWINDKLVSKGEISKKLKKTN